MDDRVESFEILRRYLPDIAIDRWHYRTRLDGAFDEEATVQADHLVAILD
jgi:hypothetical protein